MHQTRIDQDTLIKKIRRESAIGIPLVAAAMVVFAAAAAFIETGLVARAGAGVLGLTMAAALVEMIRQYGASDARLLERAERPPVWPWALLLLGVAMMSSRMETGVVVTTGVVFWVSYSEMTKRQALARLLRQNALETTGAEA